jgi:hypothetical protein
MRGERVNSSSCSSVAAIEVGAKEESLTTFIDHRSHGTSIWSSDPVHEETAVEDVDRGSSLKRRYWHRLRFAALTTGHAHVFATAPRICRDFSAHRAFNPRAIVSDEAAQ